MSGFYGPPGSSVHEILPAEILEWVAISFSNSHFTSGEIRAWKGLRNLAEVPQPGCGEAGMQAEVCDSSTGDPSRSTSGSVYTVAQR